jgi:hypothetical protein
MIDEKNWKNKNRDRNKMSADKKKRLENLDESLNDDLENDFENANFMNTKFVNLHVIFSFSI